MYNPVKHLQDSWSEMNSGWGKAAVIIFYLYVWLFILANLYQVIAPLSSGYKCVAASGDELSTIFLMAAVRAWCLALVFWGLYVENAGLGMGKLVTFTVMMGMGCFSFYLVYPNLKVIGEDDNECFESITSTYWVYWVPLVVAIGTLFMEKLSMGGTTGETTSLV